MDYVVIEKKHDEKVIKELLMDFILQNFEVLFSNCIIKEDVESLVKYLIE